jgi:hypothetical protein
VMQAVEHGDGGDVRSCGGYFSRPQQDRSEIRYGQDLNYAARSWRSGSCSGR